MKLSEKDITAIIKNGRSHVIIPDPDSPTGYKSYQYNPNVFFINRGTLEGNNAFNAEPFHVYPTGPATTNLPSSANKTGTLKAYGGADIELIYTTFTTNLLEIWGIKRTSGTWGSWSKVSGSGSGYQIASCDGVSVLSIAVPGLYANGPTTTDLPPGTNVLGVLQVLIESTSNYRWLRYQVVRNNVTETWYNARIDNTWRGWTKIPTEDYPDLTENVTINTGNYFFRLTADDGIADGSTFRIDPHYVIFGHNNNQVSIFDDGILTTILDGYFDVSVDDEEGLTAQLQLHPGYFFLEMTDGAASAEFGADGFSAWWGKNGNGITILDTDIIIGTGGSGKYVEYEVDLSAVVPGDKSIVPWKKIISEIDSKVAGLVNYRSPYDASIGTYPASGGSGTGGIILKGDTWPISVAGLGLQVGDWLIANTNSPGQTPANWDSLNANISYVPEDAANKENTTLDTSTSKYPTNRLVKEYVDNASSDVKIKYPSYSVLVSENPASEDLLYFTEDTQTFYKFDGVNYLPAINDYPDGAFTTNIAPGGWDADTNTPEILSGIGNEGDYFVVSVAGTTNLDGIDNWNINDVGWFDFANSVWLQINNQTTATEIIREINFVEDGRIMLKPLAGENERISLGGVRLSSHITALEYSTNDGASWYDITYPLNIAALAEVLFRVKNYAGTNSFGGVTIISNLV